MKRPFRFAAAVAFLLTGACGGGGAGGAPAFGISGSAPPHGNGEAAVDAAIAITFTIPVNLDTVNQATVILEEVDGNRVGAEVLKQAFNTTTVRLQPFQDLTFNTRYRVRLSGSIVSQGGSPLGADREICFITTSPFPRVRPDQVIDLGERLNVPRYLARVVRLLDGRFFVFGGYSDATDATDTIEVYDPESRTFRLHETRMVVPRAEHTATLLSSGQVLIAGGRTTTDGEALASCEIFDPGNNGIAAAASMNEPRRYAAASTVSSGTGVMVSGGFGAADEASRTVEVFAGGTWSYIGGELDEGNAQHVQFSFNDKVYIGAGNIFGKAGTFTGTTLVPRQEGDARRRSAMSTLEGDRILVVGGDTRSCLIYDFGTDFAIGATDLLRERRGAHTVTRRGDSNRRFLVAGGFNIAAQGSPALATMEIVVYLPIGPFGLSDVATFTVDEVQLPVPFAGHVAIQEPNGSTVLAGGFVEGGGDHSRRVVLVLDDRDTPPATCD